MKCDPDPKLHDAGLLVLRAGIGALFVYHGMPKILAGPPRWEALGQAMRFLGIGFAPTFWGFMAAFSEFFGGIFLVLGICTVPFAGLMAFTMVVAASMHLNSGQGFSAAAHPIAMAVALVSIMLAGPGSLTLRSTPLCRCRAKTAPPDGTKAAS